MLGMRKENRASAVGETAGAEETCFPDLLVWKKGGDSAREENRAMTGDGEPNSSGADRTHAVHKESRGGRTGRAEGRSERRACLCQPHPAVYELHSGTVSASVGATRPSPALSVEVPSSAEYKTYSYTPVI